MAINTAIGSASAADISVTSSARNGRSTTTAILPGTPKREKDALKLPSLNQLPDASHSCATIHPQPDSTNPASPAALPVAGTAAPDEATQAPNLSMPSRAAGASIDGTQLMADCSWPATLASGPAMPSAETAASSIATASVSATASASSVAGLNLSAFAAAVSPPPPELATHTASSTVAASVTAHYKTKPIPAPSSASGICDPNSEPANAIAPLPALSPSQHAVKSRTALGQQNLAEANSFATHSVLQSSSNQPAGSSHSQATSRPAPQAEHSPAAQDKGSVSTTSENNSGPSLASTVSAHPSWLQTTAAPQTASAVAAPVSDQSATQSATLLSPQSAAFTAPSPAFPQTSAHIQAQLQSNAVAEPARMVDSGQLRVTGGSSELKVSVQLPELGKIEVRAVTAHDVTTAHLTAFRPDALPALSAERTGLEQALKSRDVILGSFDAHGQAAGQHHQQSSYPSTQSSSGASSLAASVATTITAEASPTGFLPDYSSISVHV